MDKFKTLKTFMLPSEMVIIKSKLESEGIRCKTLDEHTVQTHNFLSQAIGGVQLQVMESEIARAMELLEEHGLVDVMDEPNQSAIERAVSNPKVQKKIRLFLIALISITVLLAVFLVFLAD